MLSAARRSKSAAIAAYASLMRINRRHHRAARHREGANIARTRINIVKIVTHRHGASAWRVTSRHIRLGVCAGGIGMPRGMLRGAPQSRRAVSSVKMARARWRSDAHQTRAGMVAPRQCVRGALSVTYGAEQKGGAVSRHRDANDDDVAAARVKCVAIAAARLRMARICVASSVPPRVTLRIDKHARGIS